MKEEIKQVIVYTEHAIDTWRALLDECSKKYWIERRGEYDSGLGTKISYIEK